MTICRHTRFIASAEDVERARVKIMVPCTVADEVGAWRTFHPHYGVRTWTR